MTNHFIDDSPGGAQYAANEDSLVATASPITGSGNGCTMSFVASLDVEDGFDFLVLQTSANGVNWTPQDLWTGTFVNFLDSGFDADGTDVRIGFRLVADDINEGDGVGIDDIDVNCVQAGAFNDYDSFSGTSMATPHVSGVAALALALRPGLTVSQLRDVLLSSGDPVAALAGRTVTGRRLNALGALQPPPSRTPATGAATGVTTSGATLNGAVDPLGTPTSYQFEYGTTAAYGAATAPASAGAQVGPRAVSAAIGGLAPATTYHYRVVWIRGSERAFGADGTFTTAALPKTLRDVTVKRCRVKGKRLGCTLLTFDAVTTAKLTLKKGRKTIARKTLRPTSAGVLTLKLKRKLKKGRYKLTILLRDATGGTRTLPKKTLRIR
jgi:hypothetical protein